jgi:hypothetical protein
MKPLHAPKVKPNAKSPKHHVIPSNGGKGRNKHNWGQGKLMLHIDKEKL